MNVKKDNLNYRPECWEARMIGARRLGKPTNVKLLEFLNMLSSGNSAERNEEEAYMAKEIGRPFFLQF